jgi:DUF4097 and DUF4098 domain-containing protein YvlB
MRKLAAIFTLLALPLAAAANECRYSAPRDANLDAAGLRHVLLKIGSADLDIPGVSGLTRVEVRGKACASDEAALKDLQVGASRRGDGAAVVVPGERALRIGGLFGAGYAYLILQVRVPATLAVSVQSGSGDVKAAQLAALDFSTGSGDLTATDIAGALVLRSGSGDVDARQVGSVDLRSTGSGDIKVDTVKGDVRSGQSGSGDLSFSHVGGAVSVEATGSGDIRLQHVARNAEVGSTGSGDVTASDIGGDFTVRATGSGEIRHDGVKGKVSVPAND